MLLLPVTYFKQQPQLWEHIIHCGVIIMLLVLCSDSPGFIDQVIIDLEADSEEVSQVGTPCVCILKQLGI